MNEEDVTEGFLIANWSVGHYGDEALFFGVLLVSFLKNESAESSSSLQTPPEVVHVCMWTFTRLDLRVQVLNCLLALFLKDILEEYLEQEVWEIEAVNFGFLLLPYLKNDKMETVTCSMQTAISQND
ncbi:hypothetical protein TRIATDRAFT_130827 [Trichoderma atroviride IMI 206040]|uniref:Uncharacterized protein n=1 Tax=Hypocrea atroviridis (strain ATCC 20476 / IMI 206040) TaxID=452589 RepID=G9P1P7_HYPAI|nr:uncharacterized protein TRIATDRAFT_130827 [Trichoderma atroviride IMI 206040]EHK43379.1 hypothetical protein TRIATDRAFT_130827 [Trichoderma atroviride IMI 206040]